MLHPDDQLLSPHSFRLLVQIGTTTIKQVFAKVFVSEVRLVLSVLQKPNQHKNTSLAILVEQKVNVTMTSAFVHVSIVEHVKSCQRYRSRDHIMLDSDILYVALIQSI